MKKLLYCFLLTGCACFFLDMSNSVEPEIEVSYFNGCEMNWDEVEGYIDIKDNIISKFLFPNHPANRCRMITFNFGDLQNAELDFRINYVNNHLNPVPKTTNYAPTDRFQIVERFERGGSFFITYTDQFPKKTGPEADLPVIPGLQ